MERTVEEIFVRLVSEYTRSKAARLHGALTTIPEIKNVVLYNYTTAERGLPYAAHQTSH